MGYGRRLRQRGGSDPFRRVDPEGHRCAPRVSRDCTVSWRFAGFSSDSRRAGDFHLACDKVFRIVRSEAALSRADIDRLVGVCIDDIAWRDREYESWNPRRPAHEGEFRRQSEIEIYAGLAGSVMDGRRTRAGVGFRRSLPPPLGKRHRY